MSQKEAVGSPRRKRHRRAMWRRRTFWKGLGLGLLIGLGLGLAPRVLQAPQGERQSPHESERTGNYYGEKLSVDVVAAVFEQPALAQAQAPVAKERETAEAALAGVDPAYDEPFRSDAEARAIAMKSLLRVLVNGDPEAKQAKPRRLVHTRNGIWRNRRANPTDAYLHPDRIEPLLLGLGLTPEQAKAGRERILSQEDSRELLLNDLGSLAAGTSVQFDPVFDMSFGANGIAHAMRAELGSRFFATGLVYHVAPGVWVGVMDNCGNLIRVWERKGPGGKPPKRLYRDKDYEVVSEPGVGAVIGTGLLALAIASVWHGKKGSIKPSPKRG